MNCVIQPTTSRQAHHRMPGGSGQALGPKQAGQRILWSSGPNALLELAFVTNTMPNNPLRIPSVTELLDNPQFKAVRDRVSHSVIVAKARSYLEELRTQVQTTATEVVLPTVADLAQRLAQRILQAEQSRLRPVINATGTLLHQQLGGPPLAQSALEEVVAVARDYSSLNLDLDTGETAAPSEVVQSLLQELTGAEAALVVQSGAAATVLPLAVLAHGREVIVARSQLVEMPDGRRLSDTIAASGAVLREVGAANASRIDDYRQAIGSSTAALLLVEPGAEAPVGETSRTPLAELVHLGQQHRVYVIHDLGGGAVVDLGPLGIQGVPVIADSVRAGAELVLASGEKLGGPACGLIVGRRPLIEQIAGHPLLRAMQAERLTLAALAATLRLYRQLDVARDAVPLLQLWTTSVDNLRNRAERLAPQLAACGCIASAEAVSSAAGSPDGMLASGQLPSWCIALMPAEGWSVDRLAATLRNGRPAVIGLVERERLVFDLRTVFPRQDQQLVEAVAAVVKDKQE
jgi:L-seryl-tRNA(Ser) seleniumtransferase